MKSQIPFYIKQIRVKPQNLLQGQEQQDWQCFPHSSLPNTEVQEQDQLDKQHSAELLITAKPHRSGYEALNTTNGNSNLLW